MDALTEKATEKWLKEKGIHPSEPIYWDLLHIMFEYISALIAKRDEIIAAQDSYLKWYIKHAQFEYSKREEQLRDKINQLKSEIK